MKTWSFVVYCPERLLLSVSLSTINVLVAITCLCWFFLLRSSIINFISGRSGFLTISAFSLGPQSTAFLNGMLCITSQNQCGQAPLDQMTAFYPAESLIHRWEVTWYALPNKELLGRRDTWSGLPQFGKPDSLTDGGITRYNGPPWMPRLTTILALMLDWMWARPFPRWEFRRKAFLDLPSMEANIYWALTQIRFRDIGWIIQIVTQSKSLSKCSFAWNIISGQYR